MKNSVFQSFAMISQLGITVLTPVILCTLVGMFLENYFQIPATVPMIILGILAGGRNMFVLARRVAERQSERERDVPRNLSTSRKVKEEEPHVKDE